MSSSRHIPLPVRCSLWGQAAGRCEFSGCNRQVYFHPKTKEFVNIAEAAHIIGFSEDGPRGEDELSEELAKDVSNLMLLCKICHKTVDANKENYPIDHLRKMKQIHERRIEIVTGIDTNRQSHILLYGANVGDHSSPVSYNKAANAMLPDNYPAETTPLSLGLKNSSFQDKETRFWEIESVHLDNLVQQQVRPRLASGEIEHLSIFAVAPQPLLMLLGFFLSDIPAADVFQLHREPPDWIWQEHPNGFKFLVEEPDQYNGNPALVLALSASINDKRISDVIGEDTSIWRIKIENPNNDFLKSKLQLRQFREIVRPLLNRIKAMHGEDAILHVFPAAPVSVAVEFGRIIMPKADLPMKIYDQNRKVGGFEFAIEIPFNELSKR